MLILLNKKLILQNTVYNTSLPLTINKGIYHNKSSMRRCIQPPLLYAKELISKKSITPRYIYDRDMRTIFTKKIPKHDISPHLVKIHFLGTSSATAIPGRSNTSCCYFAMDTGKSFIVDCGDSNFSQMVTSSVVNISSIEVVFVTHIHGDHYFGIFSQQTTLRKLKIERPIYVVGPAPQNNIIKVVQQQTNSKQRRVIVLEIIDDQCNLEIIEKILGLNINVIPQNHTIRSYGYVFKEMDKPYGDLSWDIVYKHKQCGEDINTILNNRKSVNGVTLPMLCPDTIYGKKFSLLQDTREIQLNNRHKSLLKDCFVMIHECTYDDSRKRDALRKRHSHPDIVASLACSLNIKHLILTHFSSRYSREKFIFTNRKNNNNININSITPILPDGSKLVLTYGLPTPYLPLQFQPRIKAKLGGYIFVSNLSDNLSDTLIDNDNDNDSIDDNDAINSDNEVIERDNAISANKELINIKIDGQKANSRMRKNLRNKTVLDILRQVEDKIRKYEKNSNTTIESIGTYKEPIKVYLAADFRSFNIHKTKQIQVRDPEQLLSWT